MATQPIDPIADPRITHRTAILNGHSYHYAFAEPDGGEFKATIFLVHGWPDLWYGWRYQIPVLIGLGFRVVALDMMGYGGTDAPKVPPESISLYGTKRAADDIAELARQLQASRVVLGGHDWGGAIVYRVALWKPELVSHVFTISTPYLPPSKTFVSIEDIVKGPLPQFGYQLQFASGELETALESKEDLVQLFKFASSNQWEPHFIPEKGFVLEHLQKVTKGPLLTQKDIEYYADQYARKGVHGSLNWYRNRRINYEEELEK